MRSGRWLLVAVLGAGCGGSSKPLFREAGDAAASGPGADAPVSLRSDGSSADGPPRTGGAFVDASYSFDAGVPATDGRAGGTDGGSPGMPPDAGSDAGSVRDAASIGQDAAPPPFDASPDVPPRCSVELRAISAASLTGLVSGPSATAVVRAEIAGVTAAGPVSWTWEVTYGDNSERITVNTEPRDSAVAEFAVVRPGRYVVSAATTAGGAACSSGSVFALARDPSAQRKLFLVRAIPPPSARAPVQHQVVEVMGGGDVVLELRLAPGTSVTINPREPTGVNTIAAYVRITDRANPLVLEGYSDANAPFGALLAAGSYDVLVVPAAADRSGVGARQAPFFLDRLDPADIQAYPFRLGPGVPVRGRARDARGAVEDARVVLRGSNVPSTVGRTAADGSFELLARDGSFGAVISPPRESGLPEASVPAGVTVADGAPGPALDFVWNPVDAVEATVAVQAPDGRPLAQARVRAEAALAEVGAFNVASARLPAAGTMRLDLASGGDGLARLGRVPRGSYNVVVSPGTSSDGAITQATLSLTGPGPIARTVRLAEKARLAGRLSGLGDLTGVRITATDIGTDLAVPPEVTETAADGSFTLSVSARRKYLLMAQPPPSSPFARSFVGAGPVEASEFTLRQTLPKRLRFSGRVVSDMQRSGVAGTVIKVFCFPGAPDCPDPTIALGEAVTATDGAFELTLPDPSSR